MSRRTSRDGARARVSLLPILALLFLAGNLCVPPRARAQESTETVSQNLRDLKSENARVRHQAALSLGNSASEQTRKAIPALIEALKDTDQTVRMAAAFALGNIPGDRQVAVPGLIEALQDKDSSVREHAAGSLGEIAQKPELAVPALVRALKDEDSSVGRSAMGALIKFGPAARTAVPDLIVLLKEKSPLPWLAAQVLGAIGPGAHAAAPDLVNMLDATSDQDCLEAADALAKIGRHQQEALETATRLLDAEDWSDRARAAGVLGDFGVLAEPSVPALKKALDDKDLDVGRVAKHSLSRIVRALREARRPGAIEPPRKGVTAMEQSPDNRAKSPAPLMASTVTAPRDMRSHDVKWQFLRPFREHPHVAFPIGGYLALALIWICLLRLSPISLLKINEVLEPVPKVKLPSWIGGMEISVSHLLLVGFFRHPDRVLDAWVGNHIESARAAFESNETVTKCADFVPGPILLDREVLPALSVTAVRPAFARAIGRLLIWGSDDDRNMNLACEIARWSMEPDLTKRLRKNLMIAVLLEQDSVYTDDKDTDPFTKTVRDKLQLDETTPSMALVARLLKRQRVLVIIRGLSDLSQLTQSSIRPSSADFPANALVVTSRIEEALGGVGKTVIHPVPLD